MSEAVRIDAVTVVEGESLAEASSVGETSPIDLSVIVPVTERPEPLVPLYREFSDAIRPLGRTFEFLFICEPYNRPRTEALVELAEAGEPIRILFVGQTTGEATLLKLAGQRARGRVLLTLPAYYRVDASGLADVLQALDDGAEMAVARRWPRNDSRINRLQNRLFHVLLGKLARGRIHDIACGVQAMQRRVLEQIPLYGDLFRFLPLLAIREGYRVAEVNVAQHAQDRRTRVYHPGVYLRRLIDVLGVFFLFRFTYKPLRFFGLVGSFFMLAGAAVLGVVALQRLGGLPLANRPMLLLGILLLTLGVQAIALGLIGEIIVHLNVPGSRVYRLRTDLPEDRS